HQSTFHFLLNAPPTTPIYTLSLHDALPIFPRQIRANTISFTVFPEIVPSIGNSFINTMKNINHTRSSISDDIRNILCSSANMRRAIPQRIFLMSSLMLLLVWLDRKSGSAGMPRPISYAVFCLKKKIIAHGAVDNYIWHVDLHS